MFPLWSWHEDSRWLHSAFVAAAICLLLRVWREGCVGPRSWICTVVKLVLTSIAVGYLMTPILHRHHMVDPVLQAWQLAAIFSAHLFNLSAPVLVLASSWRHRASINLLNVTAATFALLCGIVGEITAHFKDGWMYGPISKHSPYNLAFNLGLTSSFAFLAHALHPSWRFGVVAWAIPLAMMAFYNLGSKPAQYVLQSVATACLCRAHAVWSSGLWYLLFLSSAASIIHCTYVLVRSEQQLLHVMPSLYSWLCYVVPIIVPLEGSEFMRSSSIQVVLPFCLALVVVQGCVHLAIETYFPTAVAGHLDIPVCLHSSPGCSTVANQTAIGITLAPSSFGKSVLSNDSGVMIVGYAALIASALVTISDSTF